MISGRGKQSRMIRVHKIVKMKHLNVGLLVRDETQWTRIWTFWKFFK